VQSQQYQTQTYGQPLLKNGNLVPLRVEFVQETTVFREFGPLAGNTMRLAYEEAPPIGGTLSRRDVDVDLRYYLRLGSNGVLATRFRGLKSMGDSPDFLYFGGNSEMHGYDYLSFVGQNAMFADAELRFPLIEAALTPFGVVGGVRGVFFANIGGAWFDNQPSAYACSGKGYQFASSSTETCQAVTGALISLTTGAALTTAQGTPVLTYGPATTVSGFRLKDGRAAYGLGLETFALGFPIHFDWSWRTTFNQAWEQIAFSCSEGLTSTGQCISGAADFRRPRFAVWIGYDF